MALYALVFVWLTHWGQVIHRCVGKLTIIGSDNGLSPGRRQAIIWINDGMVLISNRNLYIFIQEKAFENVVWKMTAFGLGLNALGHLFGGLHTKGVGSCRINVNLWWMFAVWGNIKSSQNELAGGVKGSTSWGLGP